MRAAAVIAGAVLVAALGGSAAAGSGQPTHVGRYSTPDATAVVTLAPNERAYVATIRALIADVPHVEQSDWVLVRGGKSVCADVAAGATWDTFDKTITELDLDRGLYRSSISAAVTAFCPERAAGL